MTNEGLLSLCHAMKKVEAAENKPQETRLPRIRVLLAARSLHRMPPQLVDFQPERKQVQTEFEWDTNQLRLFEGVG